MPVSAPPARASALNHTADGSLNHAWPGRDDATVLSGSESMAQAFQLYDPSQLTGPQFRAQSQFIAATTFADSDPRGRGFSAAVTPPGAVQRSADERRSKPQAWKGKAKVPHVGALKPSAYASMGTSSLIPEQRCLGVRVGPLRGDGGGLLTSVLGRRDRATFAHETEAAWRGSMRNGFADSCHSTSARHSQWAANRSTVNGATPAPDHLTQPAGRHVLNSFNRSLTADLAERTAAAGRVQSFLYDLKPLPERGVGQQWFVG